MPKEELLVLTASATSDIDEDGPVREGSALRVPVHIHADISGMKTFHFRKNAAQEPPHFTALEGKRAFNGRLVGGRDKCIGRIETVGPVQLPCDFLAAHRRHLEGEDGAGGEGGDSSQFGRVRSSTAGTSSLECSLLALFAFALFAFALFALN